MVSLIGEENVRLLSDAIVLQAVMDYRRAKARLKEDRKNKSAISELTEIRQFFLSDWFCDITGADGEVILSRLENDQKTYRRLIGVYNW